MLPKGAGDFDFDGVRFAHVADGQKVGLPSQIFAGRRRREFDQSVAGRRDQRLDIAERPRRGEPGKLLHLRPLRHALPPGGTSRVDRGHRFPVARQAGQAAPPGRPPRTRCCVLLARNPCPMAPVDWQSLPDGAHQRDAQPVGAFVLRNGELQGERRICFGVVGRGRLPQHGG